MKTYIIIFHTSSFSVVNPNRISFLLQISQSWANLFSSKYVEQPRPARIWTMSCCLGLPLAFLPCMMPSAMVTSRSPCPKMWSYQESLLPQMVCIRQGTDYLQYIFIVYPVYPGDHQDPSIAPRLECTFAMSALIVHVSLLYNIMVQTNIFKCCFCRHTLMFLLVIKSSFGLVYSTHTFNFTFTRSYFLDMWNLLHFPLTVKIVCILHLLATRIFVFPLFTLKLSSSLSIITSCSSVSERTATSSVKCNVSIWCPCTLTPALFPHFSLTFSRACSTCWVGDREYPCLTPCQMLASF